MRILLYISILVGFSIATKAQSTLSGRIITEDGTPVPFGAIVGLDGKGTIANNMGNFTIELQENQTHRLIVQALGFNTDTIDVKDGHNKALICLKTKRYGLSEVAITQNQSIEHTSFGSTLSTGKKEMRHQLPKNVGEVLQIMPGFTNRSTYQSAITLRGLTGKRLMVLRNGIQRFNSYPGGFMTHTINTYDLERIDVEKGASSVLYGSGAMAGVINLVDKSPFKHQGFHSRIALGFASSNLEKNSTICGGYGNGDFGVKLGFRYRNADNFHYPNGKEAINSFYKDTDLFFSSGYKFSDEAYVILSFDSHFGGPWGKEVGFNGTNYMHVRTDIEHNYNYTLQFIRKNAKIDLFAGHEKRRNIKDFFAAANNILSYTENIHYKDFFYGMKLTFKHKITSRLSTLSGVEWHHFDIHSPIYSHDYIREIEGVEKLDQHASKTHTALFTQSVYTFSPTVDFMAGIRWNAAYLKTSIPRSEHNIEIQQKTKSALTGNLALKAEVFGHSLLKFNLARSFRMPDPTELYNEQYTANGILFGNPELLPEFNHSIDFSYRYSNQSFTIMLTPFTWLLNNMIGKEEIKGLPGTNYTYINVGKARLWGTEASFSTKKIAIMNKKHHINFNTSVALIHGTDVSRTSFLSAGTPLNYVPPMNFKSQFNYIYSNSKIETQMGLLSIYYTEQKRLGSDNYATPAYHTLNMTAMLKLKAISSQPQLNLNITNLCNSTYQQYLSYLPSPGRDIRLSITFNI